MAGDCTAYIVQRTVYGTAVGPRGTMIIYLIGGAVLGAWRGWLCYVQLLAQEAVSVTCAAAETGVKSVDTGSGSLQHVSSVTRTRGYSCELYIVYNHL